MSSDTFDSSDSVRSGQPLKHAQSVTLREPLSLELGGRLPEVTVAFETYGRLNPDGDNAVLVCHALSGDSHVAQHDADDDPGWWDIVVGPGKAIDTDRYFVICPNVLGGCRGTTGPNSINPQTGRPYATDFPVITVGDIVEVQRRLVRPPWAFGGCWRSIGGSLGGHMVLTWATQFPERCRRRGGHRHLAAADQPGPGLRRGRTQRHPPRSRLPRGAILRQRPRTGRRVWPSPGCSATSPICRAKR